MSSLSWEMFYSSLVYSHQLTSIVPLDIIFLTQVADASNIEVFHNLMSSEEYDICYTCGVAKPTACIPFSEKQHVVNAMCLTTL